MLTIEEVVHVNGNFLSDLINFLDFLDTNLKPFQKIVSISFKKTYLQTVLNYRSIYGKS